MVFSFLNLFVLVVSSLLFVFRSFNDLLKKSFHLCSLVVPFCLIILHGFFFFKSLRLSCFFIAICCLFSRLLNRI